MVTQVFNEVVNEEEVIGYGVTLVGFVGYSYFTFAGGAFSPTSTEVHRKSLKRSEGKGHDEEKVQEEESGVNSALIQR